MALKSGAARWVSSSPFHQAAPTVAGTAGMAGARPDFTGCWQLVRSEGFEGYLSSLGLHWLLGQGVTVGSDTKPIEIHHDGSAFSLRISSALACQEETFTIGHPKEVKPIQGPPVQLIAEWKGNSLVVQHIVPNGGNSVKEQTITRKMVDGMMLMTFRYENVIARRYYKKCKNLNSLGPCSHKICRGISPMGPS